VLATWMVSRSLSIPTAAGLGRTALSGSIDQRELLISGRVALVLAEARRDHAQVTSSV
jgi:hypothetical protein